MSRKTASLIYLGVLLIANDHLAVGQQRIGRTDDCSNRSIYLQFLQVSILSDSEYDNQRNVEVQLDERVFSECSLDWVFGIVSRRYPAPSRLRILVKNGIDDAGEVKQPWAEYIRDENGEAFRYKPSASYKGVKTITTRGSDPFERRNR